MTPGEREKPEIIDAGRRRRIAKGSGTNIEEVNKLLKQFAGTRKMMQQLTNDKSMMRMMRNMPMGGMKR